MGDGLPILMMSAPEGSDTMMNDREIRAAYMRMVSNIEDSVACMHRLITETKIEPVLKLKMLATSVTALTEVRDIVQEMIDVLEPKGSN